MNWYYLKNGQCVGPLPAAEIIRLVREGELLRNDRVRHDEHGPWMRVAQVPTLRPVARAGRGRAGYLAAHWRGELPLAQSFWLNAFLPLLILSAGFFAAVRSAEASADRVALLIGAAALILMPWQFIGAWRAAERHNASGVELAANAACFGLAAVVAQLFGLFAWSVPFFVSAPPQAAPAPVMVVAPGPGKTAIPASPKAVAVTLPVAATARTPPPTAAELLARTEPFATLREHAPAEYQVARELVERAQRSGASEQAALAQAAGLIQQLSERYMPLAPDAALSAYVGVLVRELQALQAKDASLCARFAYPQDGAGVRLSEHVDAALLQAERAALTELIRAALLQPQPRARFEDVQQELVGVYRRIAERHGAGVYRLDRPQETGFDEAQLCQVTIDIYSEFQGLPPRARGPVLRFTLGS